MLHILLVDDDATDRELFIDAMNIKETRYNISEASNGQEAIDYLKATDRLPDLIILDLNMPVKDGRETLKEIRADNGFRSVPVCILSTSSAHFDVLKAYEAGANLFMVKPLDFKQLIDMTSSLLMFFNKYVMLPTRPLK
jgi:CheY-like chemotaxis protein